MPQIRNRTASHGRYAQDTQTARQPTGQERPHDNQVAVGQRERIENRAVRGAGGAERDRHSTESRTARHRSELVEDGRVQPEQGIGNRQEQERQIRGGTAGHQGGTEFRQGPLESDCGGLRKDKESGKCITYVCTFQMYWLCATIYSGYVTVRIQNEIVNHKEIISIIYFEYLNRYLLKYKIYL